VASVPEQQTFRRVEVSFVGPVPAHRVRRASGVSDVEIDGCLLRCLVSGSFQPFLEALRGHEVVGLTSTSVGDAGAAPDTTPATSAQTPASHPVPTR